MISCQFPDIKGKFYVDPKFVSLCVWCEQSSLLLQRREEVPLDINTNYHGKLNASLIFISFSLLLPSLKTNGTLVPGEEHRLTVELSLPLNCVGKSGCPRQSVGDLLCWHQVTTSCLVSAGNILRVVFPH